jgi:hypothetical protein
MGQHAQYAEQTHVGVPTPPLRNSLCGFAQIPGVALEERGSSNPLPHGLTTVQVS